MKWTFSLSMLFIFLSTAISAHAGGRFHDGIIERISFAEDHDHIYIEFKVGHHSQPHPACHTTPEGHFVLDASSGSKASERIFSVLLSALLSKVPIELVGRGECHANQELLNWGYIGKSSE